MSKREGGGRGGGGRQGDEAAGPRIACGSRRVMRAGEDAGSGGRDEGSNPGRGRSVELGWGADGEQRKDPWARRTEVDGWGTA